MDSGVDFPLLFPLGLADYPPESENNPMSEESNTPPPDEANRRSTQDRRKENIPVAFERRSGLDRRIPEEKRRMIDPVTFEKEYDGEESEFLRAIDLYKRINRRPFPTWCEVLEVLRALGYRKVADPTPLPGLPMPKPPKAEKP